MRPVRLLSTLLAFSTGCAYLSDMDEQWRLDPDGDGVPIGTDCDDEDGAVGAPQTFFADADGDGHGDPGTEETACLPPAGFVVTSDDCDDADAAVYPGAPDAWYDGVDADCAGNDDYDQDGDGYGIDEDCDDENAALVPDPDAPEIPYNGVDDNCFLGDGDGDADGDGFWAADYAILVRANGGEPLAIPPGAAGDCWDDPSVTPLGFDSINGFPRLSAGDVNPDATETFYDGVDQDCGGQDVNVDGILDDFDWDLDGDASATWADPSGLTGGDCIDCDCEGAACPAACDAEAANPAGLAPSRVNSAAAETWYDGTDQDCRGDDDYDRDNDGYDCDSSHGGNCTGSDCDDLADRVHPGAVDDWYDGIDSDCGGEDDFDQDGDGYQAEDYGGDDCDDLDSSTNPGAAEIWYDGFDQNCDGADDYDQDGDGWRSDAYGGSDCLDTNASVNVGQREIEGNGLDDDCSGDSNGNQLEGLLNGSDADASWRGTTAGDAAGHRVSGAGDVNGDGLDDYLVAAPYNDLAGSSAGVVYLVHGPGLAGGLLSSANASLYGEAASDLLGWGLTGLGDTDGDGFDDFALGSYSANISNTDDGAAYIVYGPVSLSGYYVDYVADGMYWGAYAGSYAGYDLSSAGDHNADGYADLIVGAPYDSWDGSYSGRAWVVQGPLTGVESLAGSPEISPEVGDYDYLGYASAGVDLTGDGQSDVALSAPNANVGTLSYGGVVYVFDGPITGDLTAGTSTATARITAVTDGQFLGSDLSGGDIDGDGYNDLLIGATNSQSTSGSYVGGAYVVLGPVTTSGSVGSLAHARILGRTSYGNFGESVELSGDYDGDGNADLLIGSSGDTGLSSYEGANWVFYGPVTGALTANANYGARLGGNNASDAMSQGRSAGDVDGDGYDDVIGGARGADSSAVNAGAAYLWLGGAL